MVFSGPFSLAPLLIKSSISQANCKPGDWMVISGAGGGLGTLISRNLPRIASVESHRSPNFYRSPCGSVRQCDRSARGRNRHRCREGKALEPVRRGRLHRL